MNKDIRLSVDFWSHPKTIKTAKKLGLDGIRSLQILWCWVAKNRPDGILTNMDSEDIEIASDWRGEENVFFNACLGVWIDECSEHASSNASSNAQNNRVYKIHGWEQHQGWAMHAKERSEKAKKAAEARWKAGKKDNKKQGVNATSMQVAMPQASFSNAPSPSPSPSPYKEKVLTNVSTKKKNFIPPSLREVEAYVAERGNKINSQKFIDYYTSNGWMVGRNKMRDWKAAIRNWESNKSFSTGGSNGAPPKQTKREAYKAAVIEGVSFLKEMETEYSEKGSQS